MPKLEDMENFYSDGRDPLFYAHHSVKDTDMISTPPIKDTDMISTPPIKSFNRELQAADHAANNKDQTAYKASKESTAL
jgi:hypothetical protein